MTIVFDPAYARKTILPIANNTLNLGSASLTFAAAYIGSINNLYLDKGANSATLTGNTALGGSSLRDLVKATVDFDLGSPPVTIDFNTSATENTGVGEEALRELRYGSDNTAVGSRACRDQTDAYYNTGIGHYALGFNILGWKNVAIGAFSMKGVESVTTCHNNVAVGFRTMYLIQDAQYCTAVGHEALLLNVSGVKNTGVGNNALGTCTGDNNTTLGSSAGYELTTGDDNIVIGKESGYGLTTGSGNTIIGTGVSGLSSSLANNIILASGSAGSIKAQHDGTDWTLNGDIRFTNSTDTIHLKNNVYVDARNAANGADLALIKIDSNDDTYINFASAKAFYIDQNESGQPVIKLTTSSGRPRFVWQYNGGTVAGQLATFATSIGLSTITNHPLLIQINNQNTWQFETNGDLTQQAATGGRIIMPRALNEVDTGLVLGASARVADQSPAALTVVSDINTNIQALFQQSTNDVNGILLYFNKTRKTDNTADTIVANGDAIATLMFQGADGASFRNAAAIKVLVDGTPGASDMPGRIEFQTTPDGSASIATRWSILSSGILSQDATSGGALVFNTSSGLIRQGTTDGVDNKSISIAGGGGQSTSRGAVITLYGLESNNGGIDFEVGNHASALFRIYLQNSLRWSFDGTGQLLQDGTNGSDIVFSKTLTGITGLGKLNLERTNTAGGTTGAQTINKMAGSVNFAAAATSLVVTNSLVSATSNVFACIQTNDSTATIKNCVPAAGSFTITLTAAATAETRVAFWVTN